jgi:hypothetical protein
VGLLLLIVSSGAAAGLFYHLTRPLRSTGAPGHYAGALLTVLGFFLSVYGLVDLAALLVGWDAATRNVRDMVTTPTGWAVTFSLTLAFGLVLGRTLRGL